MRPEVWGDISYNVTGLGGSSRKGGRECEWRHESSLFQEEEFARGLEPLREEVWKGKVGHTEEWSECQAQVLT